MLAETERIVNQSRGACVIGPLNIKGQSYVDLAGRDYVLDFTSFFSSSLGQSVCEDSFCDSKPEPR